MMAGTLLTPLQVMQEQLTGHDIPWESVGGPPWWVTYLPEATPEQIAEGNAIAAAFDGEPMRYRTLHAIYLDVNALPGPAKTAIAADLFGGTPPKALLDRGPNVASVFVMGWAIDSVTITQADRDRARLLAIVFYVQDNAYYLDHPDFATQAVLLGVEPIS